MHSWEMDSDQLAWVRFSLWAQPSVAKEEAGQQLQQGSITQGCRGQFAEEKGKKEKNINNNKGKKHLYGLYSKLCAGLFLCMYQLLQ